MEILKVTDTAKAVTDPVLLKALAGQGIAADGVEMEQDYGQSTAASRNSPYAKLYRDFNSDRKFAVISGLPMVDAYGQKHDLVWRGKNGTIENGNNIFHTIIDGLDTRLVALSSQPGGMKKNDQISFHPQLFVGGSEVKPLSLFPVLLETDPVNGNYHNNVLEWEYGICKRRIRIIEGRFLGSWVFLADPRAAVRVKYNQSAENGLHLGCFAVSPDEEYIPATYFEQPLSGFPVVISDSATFYPDADPETNSCDGIVRRSGTDLAWSDIRDGAGTLANDVQAASNLYIQAGTSSGWALLHRLLFFFNITGLSGTISAAALSLYGSNKGDNLGNSPTINIYGCNSASTNSLAPSDYGTALSTAFAPGVSYVSFNTGSYNDFALDAGGIANIPVGGGLSRFSARLANSDVANSAPGFVSGQYSFFLIYMAEQGSGYKPKLVVTYSTGVPKSSSDNGSGADIIVLRSLGVSELGSGTEASAVAASLSTGDAGSASESGSSEAGGPSQSVSGADAGTAIDALKSLVRKGGIDMKLNGNAGQLGLPDKEVYL